MQRYEKETKQQRKSEEKFPRSCYLGIQESLDTPLRCFCKLLGAYLYFCDFLVAWQLLIELLAVLLHDILDIILVEVHVLRLVIVRLYASDEFRVTLYDHALHH